MTVTKEPTNISMQCNDEFKKRNAMNERLCSFVLIEQGMERAPFSLNDPCEAKDKKRRSLRLGSLTLYPRAVFVLTCRP